MLFINLKKYLVKLNQEFYFHVHGEEVSTNFTVTYFDFESIIFIVEYFGNEESLILLS